MSKVLPFRCVICTLYYYDSTIYVERTQGERHIFYDHDYADKLMVARFIGLISDNEKRGKSWLSYHLCDLSIVRQNKNE